MYKNDHSALEGKLTKTSRSTNSMKIGLSHSWEIEVYDNVDSLNIDTTRKEIGTDQVSAKTLEIIVKNLF